MHSSVFPLWTYRRASRETRELSFTVFIITTSRQNVTKAICLVYYTTTISPVCIFASTTTAYVIIYFTPFPRPLFLFAMSFIQAI